MAVRTFQLRVANMTRSGKGKHGLNRSILEQRWGILRHQLEYKAETAGRTLISVDPAYTSQACSRCGHIDASARRGKRYACSACGLSIDADLNASRTILMRGLAALGGPIDRPWDAQYGGIAATTSALAGVVPEIRTGTPATAQSRVDVWMEPVAERATAQSAADLYRRRLSPILHNRAERQVCVDG